MKLKHLLQGMILYDMDVDGLLHGALKLSDHARADVVAINVDEARARGVVGVFTAADIPGEIRVGLIHKDWPVMIPKEDERLISVMC